MKKVLCILTLLCAVVAGAWAETTEQWNSIYGTWNSSHSTVGSLPTEATKTTYVLSTPRGTLLANSSESSDYLLSNSKKTDYSTNEKSTNFQFLLFPSGSTNGYYIYSVGLNKFISTKDGQNVRMSETPVELFIFKNNQTRTNQGTGISNQPSFDYANFPFTVSHQDNTVNGQAIVVSNWNCDYGTRNSGSDYDGGNVYKIVEAESVSDDTFNEVKSKIQAIYQEKITALQNKIDDILHVDGGIMHQSIGYPKSTSSSVLSLMSYAEAFGNTVTADNYDNASQALIDLYAETDINLPEDGKAYYFVNYQMVSNTNKTLTGNKYMLAYNADGTNQLMTEPYTEGSTTPDEDNVFIARKVNDNRFVFVTKDGKYLRYYANSSNNNRQGALSDTYSVNEGSVLIAKQQLNGVYTQVTLDECFGFVTVQGWRTDKQKDCDIIINGRNGSFSGTDGSIIRYNNENDQYSTAFRIIEVPDGNSNILKLTKPESTHEGGLNQKYVGTFSAPYNVELPEDVKAYTATQDGSTINFNLLGEGNLVPKNTGVLVYAENAKDAINKAAIPAATTMQSMENVTNLLVGTNGEDINVPTTTTAYILAAKNEGVLFYALSPLSRKVSRNRAYLDLTNKRAVNAFRFDFEEQTTGIEIVESIAPAKSAFDLSGRSVKANQRGLYILEGKKVIR